MRPQIGEVINGKYRLLRLIGEGGMGSVFEARHEYLGSAVALKFLDSELAKRSGLVARFLQEARVSAAVRSPHVVHVSDVDQSSAGLPYLVMELLEGESLQKALARAGKLPVETALDFAMQMLNGLEAAHAAGVVHRDLKPDNVFVVPTRQGPLVKLLDFGIAKLRVSEEFQRGLTRPGVLMGTPEYMAPEQAFSADMVDARADIYAAGVILFEMISGRRPISGDDARIMAAAVLSGAILRLSDIEPGLPPGLCAAVQRALSGRVADRFSGAAEMRAALGAFAKPTPLSVAGVPEPAALTPVQPVPGVWTAGGGMHPQAEVGAGAAHAPAAGPVPGGGVAPTLPPTDSGQGPAPRTGTVVGQPGQVAMGGTEYAAPAQVPSPGYVPMHPQPSPYAPPVYAAMQPAAAPAGSGKGLSALAIVATIAGGLVAVGVVGIVVARNRGWGPFASTDDPGPTATITAGPPPTFVSPPPTETATTPPPPTVTATTPTATATATSTGTTTKRDAGSSDAGAGGSDAGSSSDGGSHDAGRAFPFPSALPFPVPGFPSGFPWPGQPPAKK
jgi:serine/threonine-protein kinase